MMPIPMKYPGVYIEERSGGMHTIEAVPTSITAFVGRTPSGPVDTPVAIHSFADFERCFGGLAVDRPLGHAVRDFYLNGGADAVIVRLFSSPAIPADAFATVTVDNMELVAASPGVWGKALRVSIDADVPDAVRIRMGLGAADVIFNMTVLAGPAVERFASLCFADHARRIDRVLAAESALVRWSRAVVPAAGDRLPLLDDAIAAADRLERVMAAEPPIPDDIALARVDLADARSVLRDAASQAEAALIVATASGQADRIAVAGQAVVAAEATMKGDDGLPLDDAAYAGDQAGGTGIFALDRADLFNLLCIPPDLPGASTTAGVYRHAMDYCLQRRAMLLVDPPVEWSRDPASAVAAAVAGLPELGFDRDAACNAAMYFPLLLVPDPLRDGLTGLFTPSGAVAGIIARTDRQRGIWKAPAGIDASIVGTRGLAVRLTDGQNARLNSLGINCLREFDGSGKVVWGARTLRGDDRMGDEYKYIPVRRTALLIEESLYRGTRWAVFEANDEALWSQIRLNVGAFMQRLFRQGAFQGQTPRDTYFVRCGDQTMSQNDIDRGTMTIMVGFAPLKPAEFVTITIRQTVGQTRA